MARIASEQQFQAWEKLIDEGKGRYEAAQEVGTTLSALKRGDRVRFDNGLDLSLERQSAKAEKLIAGQVNRPEPSPQLIALEVKAHHPDYADKTQIEVSGTVQHEHRGEFSLGHLIEVARRAGIIEQLDDRPEDALPAAREIPARSS